MALIYVVTVNFNSISDIGNALSEAKVLEDLIEKTLAGLDGITCGGTEGTVNVEQQG